MYRRYSPQFFVIIPFAQPSGRKIQTWPDAPPSPTKIAAAETEGMLVQIGLKVFLGQAMIGAQNKFLCVADYDVQPVEQTRIGIVRLVLVGVAFQRGDVTAVSIAVDHAAIGKSSILIFLAVLRNTYNVTPQLCCKGHIVI